MQKRQPEALVRKATRVNASLDGDTLILHKVRIDAEIGDTLCCVVKGKVHLIPRGYLRSDRTDINEVGDEGDLALSVDYAAQLGVI